MLFTPLGATDDRIDTTTEELAARWWLPLGAGVVTIVAGIVLFTFDWTVTTLATATGAVFVYRGLVRTVTPTWSAPAHRFNIGLGLLGALAGLAVMAWPDPTLVVLSLFIGSYLIADGVVLMAGAVECRRMVDIWWLWLVFGAAMVFAGFLALRRQDAALESLTAVAGLWAVVVGTAEITAAFQLRRAPHEPAPMAATDREALKNRTIILDGTNLSEPEQLTLLDQLRHDGVVTNTEYHQLKARITTPSSTTGRSAAESTAPSAVTRR